MPIAKSVDVHYHLQDLDTYCGPATAMMILHFLNPAADPLPQAALRQAIPTSSSSNAPPDGVARALEKRKPPNSRFTFAVDTKKSPDAANNVIVRALYHTGMPAAAEYFGGNHWVVVRGTLTDIVPEPGLAYKVLGFFIHSPLVPPDQGDYAHRDGDRCGQGPEFGPVHEFVSAADWQGYFKKFDDTYVSVVATPKQRVTRRTKSVRIARSSEAFDPLQRAMQGIAENELASKGPLSDLLTGASATSVIGPLRGTFFVDLTRNGMNVGRARVAESDGTFLGAIVTEPGHLRPILSADEMAPRIADAIVPFGTERRRLAEFEHALSAPYWRPCREAVSPYYPFYDVKVKTTSRVKHCYATADGRLHRTLHFYDVPAQG